MVRPAATPARRSCRRAATPGSSAAACRTPRAPRSCCRSAGCARVREVDPVAGTITVDAGVVLADVQAAAEKAGRLFPMSLGSEGSCTIGGNLATNAGGTAVLRYGMIRELVLGLEVVLPDGRVWDGLRGLRKDNTGYDLKQLFVGSEGTLGVITGAVLRLFPATPRHATAWVAVPSVAAAVALLGLAQQHAGAHLSTLRDRQPPGPRAGARAPARRERPAGGAERVVRPGRARRHRVRRRPRRRPRGRPRRGRRGRAGHRRRDREQPGPARPRSGRCARASPRRRRWRARPSSTTSPCRSPRLAGLGRRHGRAARRRSCPACGR